MWIFDFCIHIFNDCTSKPAPLRGAGEVCFLFRELVLELGQELHEVSVEEHLPPVLHSSLRASLIFAYDPCIRFGVSCLVSREDELGIP